MTKKRDIALENQQLSLMFMFSDEESDKTVPFGNGIVSQKNSYNNVIDLSSAAAEKDERDLAEFRARVMRNVIDHYNF